MSKSKNDLTLTGHRNGDEDGLGPFRGAFVCFGIEVAAAVVFGLVLFAVWK